MFCNVLEWLRRRTLITSFIMFYNVLYGRVAEEENIDHKFSVARVTCNGTVKWTQRKVFKCSCPIDMRNFPFDRQRCDLVSSTSYLLRS